MPQLPGNNGKEAKASELNTQVHHVTTQLPGKTAQRRNRRPPQHPGLACKLMGDVKSTGLGRDRLRSVDRNNKTTLLLTRRCGTNKSYAKDLSPRMVKLQDVS
jgi:hypothetical protein